MSRRHPTLLSSLALCAALLAALQNVQTNKNRRTKDDPKHHGGGFHRVGAGAKQRLERQPLVQQGHAHGAKAAQTSRFHRRRNTGKQQSQDHRYQQDGRYQSS